MSRIPIGLRWLRFNAAGALGFLVQVGVIALLVEGGVHYLAAAAIALEAAILHNFVWHSRWTWRDRAGRGGRLNQFGRFNTVHGATALLNLACMSALVDGAGLSYLPATCLSVAACSVLNFRLCHTAVFSSGPATPTGCLPSRLPGLHPASGGPPPAGPDRMGARAGDHVGLVDSRACAPVNG